MKSRWGKRSTYPRKRGGQRQRQGHRWTLTLTLAAVAVLALVIFGLCLVLRQLDGGEGREGGLSQGQERQWLTGEDFGIEQAVSPVDFNGNGQDDYMDILLGARKDAQAQPKYESGYYDGGYPPDDVGVCTDVIWRAFREAGYCLRDMVDQDIKLRPEAYPWIEVRDRNIDFRRVSNLRVFFEKYGQSLTLDIEKSEEWQPGDIVVFGPDDKHIGIISDRRTEDGRPLVIHNAGQHDREQDYLKWAGDRVTGHYRFDADKIDENLLIPWE